MSLRRRLGWALAGLSLATAALFAVGAWAAYAYLESTALNQLLGHELDVLVQSGAAPRGEIAHTGLRYYRSSLPGPDLPPQLAALPPGSYRDFALPGGSYHVLVRELGPGDRLYLSYDVKTFQQRERWLALALAAAVLVAALLAWPVSGWLAGRALRPLETMVARIRGLDVDGKGKLAVLPQYGELAEIARALNERIADIEALLARERAFAAAASHELRTPLASIRGAAEVLASQPGAQTQVLARIGRAVTAATDDLDALLALSRARELPATQKLELHRLLPELVEPYAEAVQAQGTTLHWQLQPCELLAPAGVLGIIFTNLLRNALHAAPGGTVRIDLRPGRLIVADDGHGIAPEDLARIFEPGVRRSQGGSGMGLYIARTLAERYGFQLRLSSESNQGTAAELRFG